jgi:hypothetical protein
MSVPAHLQMSPPDLSPLTNGDEEYILVKVSKKKRRCWVTYLNGEDPETEREFHIGTTVSGLLAPKHAEVVPPQHPRLARVQLGEMIERRIEERKRELTEKQRESTRNGAHTRFRNLATSEPGEEIPVPRELKKSCKTQSPESPDPSPLTPRTQWMMENDSCTTEQADADWRRVTESLFDTNTRAEPKVDGESWGSEAKSFVPNWGNNLLPVSQDLIDEEKRWADLWKRRKLNSERREIDEQRKGGGSPLRGNRKLQSTFLDEIDDPHGDYARAGAAGYDRGPQYPYKRRMYVRRHDAEVWGLVSWDTNPERASSSSAPDRNRRAQHHLSKQIKMYTRVNTV